MKKKIILVVVIILVSLISFKVIMVNYYSFKDIDKYAKNYIADKTITTKIDTNDNLDYINYQNIILPNLFKDYKDQVTNDSLILVKDNNKVTIAISNSPFQELTKDKDVNYYLNKNKINNELEILAYIASQKYQKDANILSSIKYLKGRKALLKYVYDNIPLKQNTSLEIINGNYEGYIIKDTNYEIINIILKDKLYIITLETKEDVNEKLILNNLIIKESNN